MGSVEFMSHTIVRTAKGKQKLVAEGSLREMNRRLKQLRRSTARGVSGQMGRKYKVQYHIVPPPEEGDES